MLLEAHLSGVYSTPAPGSFTVSLRYARGCMPISFTVREPGGIRGVLSTSEALLSRASSFTRSRRSMLEHRSTFPSSGCGREPADASSSRRFRAGNTSSSSTLTIVRIDGVRSPRHHPGTRVPGEAKIVTVDGPTIVDAGTFQRPRPCRTNHYRGGRLERWGPGFRRRAGSARRGAGEVPLDTAGRFRVTLPYGARFTLRAEGRREVNGRVRESSDVSTEIGRNDRDRRTGSCCGCRSDSARLPRSPRRCAARRSAGCAAWADHPVAADEWALGGEADSILVHAGQLIVPLHNGVPGDRVIAGNLAAGYRTRRSWGMTKAGPDLFVFKQRGLHRAADLGARG